MTRIPSNKQMVDTLIKKSRNKVDKKMAKRRQEVAIYQVLGLKEDSINPDLNPMITKMYQDQDQMVDVVYLQKIYINTINPQESRELLIKNKDMNHHIHKKDCPKT